MPKGGKPPEDNSKGTTGRFVPCPAMPWRHPEARGAFEVKWSAKKKHGRITVYYYYKCSECEPNTNVFLNDWTEQDGFTVIEAEAQGFRPKVSRDRKALLLKELGYKEVRQPAPPHMPPPGPWPAQPHPAQPHPAQPRYMPPAAANPKSKRPKER